MSITLKVIDLIDRLKVQRFFIEKNNKTYFSPIFINFNPENFEKIADHLVSSKGKPYEPNDLEKAICKELDF